MPEESTGQKTDPASLAACLRADQQQRWRRGQRILVEDYLAQHTDLRTDEAGILDLLYGEMLLREEQGESPRLEEYQQRFPQYVAPLARQFDLHAALAAESLLADLSPLPTASLDDPRHSTPGPGGEGAVAETLLTGTATQAVPGLSAASWPTVAGYDILEEVGRGGMGVVYRAQQRGLNRPVALKMILSGAHAGAEELTRFRAEAETVARLRHPNIIQIYEIGEQNGRPFFSLEYAEGGSLSRQLAGKPQPAAAAAQLVEMLARAVQHAHAHGIVHRDLKPANVLLMADGTVKVTDFGLAKRLEGGSGQTRTGDILGTPSYMAPEQASGSIKRIGPAADIYALGAILYELLTGRPPFLGESAWDTVNQVLTQDPVPPRRLQPKVPRDLETITLHCLHKDAKKRYGSAEELAEDLRRFQAGEPIRARPGGAGERLVKWIRRRPAEAFLTALIVLVTTLGVGLVTWKWREAEANAAEAQRQQQRAEADFRQTMDTLEQLTHVGYDELQRLLQQPKSLSTLQELIKIAVDSYQRLLDRHGDDPDLRAKVAASHRRLGNIYLLKSDYTAAESHYRQAVEGYQQLLRTAPDTLENMHGLGDSCQMIGTLLRLQKHLPESLTWYDQAIEALEKVLREDAQQSEARQELFHTRCNRADVLNDLGRHGEALQELKRAPRLDTEAHNLRLRLLEAMTDAYLGKHAEAVRIVQSQSANFKAIENVYDAACIYALAAQAVRQDTALANDERGRLIESYLGKSLKLLNFATAQGYFQVPANFDNLQKDPALAFLRETSGYRQLLDKLRTASAPVSKK